MVQTLGPVDQEQVRGRNRTGEGEATQNILATKCICGIRTPHSSDVCLVFSPK